MEGLGAEVGITAGEGMVVAGVGAAALLSAPAARVVGPAGTHPPLPPEGSTSWIQAAMLQGRSLLLGKTMYQPGLAMLEDRQGRRSVMVPPSPAASSVLESTCR